MDTRQSIRDLHLNLTLSLLNAQSIKNKELVLHGQLIHHDVDYMYTNRDMAEQKCIQI